ncbi:MAG: addiction module protein [Thermoanaerobaculia bacterium]
MSNDAELLLERALQLRPNDRAKLAAELLASLDEQEEGVAEAWALEIERRAADVTLDRDNDEDWRAAFEEIRSEVLSR